MLTSKNPQNPPLRFKNKSGENYPDWETKKLGEILYYIQPTQYLVTNKLYNNNYKTPVLTAGKTFILGYTNEEDGIFNNLPVIIFDDFTTATKLVNFPFKVKSSALKILYTNNSNSINFLYESIQTIYYPVKEHQRHWISKFSFLNILIPSLEEQTKIGDFLKAVDDKIDLQKNKIEKLKNYKTYLMQQLFPQNNQQNPTLRFKNKSGENYPDWQTKKLGEIILLHPFNPIKVSEAKAQGDIPVISQDNNFICGYSNSSNHIVNSTPIILYGDHTTIIKFINFKFIVGGDGVKLIKNQSLDNIMLLYYLMIKNNIKFEGYKRHFPILKTYIVSIPQSIEEQTKIGDFLKAVDDKIDLQKNKLEKLKNYKTYLMQNLFPST